MHLTNFKKLRIWTSILNFLIIVGIGHGLLFFGVVEVLSILGLVTGRIFNSDYFSFSLLASYDKSIGVAALFSLLGQIVFIVLIFKKQREYFWLQLTGLCLFWIGFYYLTHNIINDPAALLSFVTGLPFLIASLLLAYKAIKNKAGTNST